MSKVSTRIWRFSKQRNVYKLTLLALAESANDESVCFSGPSFADLSTMINANRRSAIRVVEKLAESGELFYKPTVGRGNTNLYFITAGLTTGEVTQVLTTVFEMNPLEVKDVLDSLIKKGVIYDIQSVTDNTISKPEKPEKGVMDDQKGVTYDIKGVIREHHDNNKDEINTQKFWYSYQSEIGGISQIIQNRIDDYIEKDNCPIAWMIEAIDICVENNVRKPVYLFSVIENAIAQKLAPRQAWEKKNTKPPRSTRTKVDDRPFVSPLPPTPDLPPPEPLPPYAALWEQAAGILRSQLTKAAYDQVLGQCTPQPNHNGTFVLGAPAGICPQVERARRQILIALKQFKPDIKELEVVNL